jgi:hypothetical protein
VFGVYKGRKMTKNDISECKHRQKAKRKASNMNAKDNKGGARGCHDASNPSGRVMAPRPEEDPTIH